MPSQNLPKPNLPGQKQPVLSPVVPDNSSPTDAQTVFAAKPAQISQRQSVPAGLSRENPGGTPPNMTVSAPSNSLAQSEAKTPPAPVSEPVKAPLPSRPISPLDQINLADQKPLSAAAVPASPAPLNQVSPAATLTSAQPKPSSKAVPQTVGSPTTLTGQVSDNFSTVAASESDAQAAELPSDTKTGFFGQLKSKFPLPVLIGVGLLLVVLLGASIFSLLRPKTSITSSNSDQPASTSSGTTSTTSTAGTTGQITTLTYWGLWEDSQILKEVIADFEKKNPNIKIDYRKQSHRDYRERLQQAIASGSGPDLFRYHVSWVPMLSDDLAAMPTSVMSMAEYKEVFYPTAYNNLQVGGQIVGIPLMYDGLALFYNKEMLRTANIDVPKTWAELRTAANKLTVPANVSERSSGNVTRSGLAIGTAGNVDHFSDILALLIVQNGGNPADASSQYVRDAVTFYTNFMKQDRVWSERLANSTTAFARGDVAMIFAPSWRIHDIKNLNPNLDFAVARLPQLDADNPITWATFWAEGVSDKSKNKEAAWAFLKHMSTPDTLRKFYNDASQYRTFGEIYPRADMASELTGNEWVGAFVADAPLAKSWYMSSFTHDNGLNDQIIKYYEDAITAALSTGNVEKALETTATGVKSVLSKY